MRRRELLATTLATMLLLGGMAARASEPWIHVKVDSGDRSDESVRVSLPLSLVQTLLPMVDAEPLHEGKLVLDDVDLQGIDLPAILAELNKVGDADLIRVRDGDETVSVSKKDGFFLIHVDGSEGREKVRVRMPLAIVEALLGNDPDGRTLDLSAGLRALAGFEGDLVTVEDGDDTVRVWIDARNYID